MRAFFLCLFIVGALNVNAQQAFHKTMLLMGSHFDITVVAQDEEQGKAYIDTAIAEITRVEKLISSWDPNSQTSEINRNAGTRAVQVDKELFDLIERSIYFSELTQGAFDITYASIGYLYDYRHAKKPDDDNIEQSLDAINYRHIILDGSQHSVKFRHKDTKIDLGGIAKGYAVDNAIQLIINCGVRNALVSAGGDSRILGDKNGKPWMMGIQHPRNKSRVVVRIPLRDSAISTSGDYQRFFIQSGERYHHIIQPQSGRSVDHTWSTSILADNALTADALSTSAFVMGTEKALQLINSLEHTEAIIIDSKGKMHYSSGLIPPTTH